MKLLRWSALLLVITSMFAAKARSADWPPINPEDLSMKDIKEQPGAPALILLREETDDDMNNAHSVYERIKILTDAGREYANVELPYSRRGFSIGAIIGAISGRTVHTDGSIAQFAGKPFDKTVVRSNGIRINVKSFTLPDVQVGSIIEYRYSLRYEDHMLLPPEWEVQKELFQRKATFKFIPFQNHGSSDVILDHGQIAKGVAWTPLLGDGPQPQIHNQATSTFATVHDVSYWVDLTRENVPAFIEEPFMPPPSVLKWRVYFYYQRNMKAEDYWKTEGKFWSKEAQAFMDKDRGEKDALAKLLQPTDSTEQKVRKIYAFVSGLENQDFIPERTAAEQKVLQIQNEKGAADILDHRSGSHDDLNRLFVSMVRAAGIPASLIWVPDRSTEVFLKAYLSTRQFDAEIAVVQIEGKDVFLDPGTKFCPYGIVDWRYSGVEGLRQSGGGADVIQTPSPGYAQAVSTRNANVSLDEHGTVTGTVSLVFKGLAGMQRRQDAAKTDADGRKKLLEDELRELLPGNSEVKLINSPDWDGTENPLTAEFRISSPFAVAAGKRLMLAQHLFQMNDKARFPATSRKNAICFHYPWQEADEVRIQIPAGMEVESLAPGDTVKLGYAFYRADQKQEAPNRIYSRRDFIMAAGILLPEQYQEVKGFFDKVKSDDDQPALVRLSSSVATN